MLANETWRDAVPRAVQEELGTVLPQNYQVLSISVTTPNGRHSSHTQLASLTVNPFL